MRAQRRARNQRILRVVALGIVGLFLAYPLYALFEFSIRFPLTGKYSWDAWARLFGGGSDTARLAPLYQGLTNSLIIVVLTLTIMFVILLPTMVWVRLKVPQLRRVLEFVCLLPLTLPAIVLVVGLVPVYRFIATQILDTNAIWLSFAYVILVLRSPTGRWTQGCRPSTLAHSQRQPARWGRRGSPSSSSDSAEPSWGRRVGGVHLDRCGAG